MDADEAFPLPPRTNSGWSARTGSVDPLEELRKDFEVLTNPPLAIAAPESGWTVGADGPGPASAWARKMDQKIELPELSQLQYKDFEGAADRLSQHRNWTVITDDQEDTQIYPVTFRTDSLDVLASEGYFDKYSVLPLRIVHTVVNAEGGQPQEVQDQCIVYAYNPDRDGNNVSQMLELKGQCDTLLTVRKWIKGTRPELQVTLPKSGINLSNGCTLINSRVDYGKFETPDVRPWDIPTDMETLFMKDRPFNGGTAIECQWKDFEAKRKQGFTPLSPSWLRSRSRANSSTSHGSHA